MIKFFQKKSKKTYFRAILGPFSQIWAKMNFLEKGLYQFLNIPIIYPRVKNQKKLMSCS